MKYVSPYVSTEEEEEILLATSTTIASVEACLPQAEGKLAPEVGNTPKEASGPKEPCEKYWVDGEHHSHRTRNRGNPPLV